MDRLTKRNNQGIAYMTIAEIIEELEKYDKRANVRLYNDEDYILSKIIYDQDEDEIYLKFD